MTRQLCLAAAILNILAVVLFLGLLLVLPLSTQLSARMRFTELDRADVINARELTKFHASYGFGDPTTLEYRRTVPDYITQSTLGGLRFAAAAGLICALGNSIFGTVTWRLSAPRSAKPDAPSR